MLNQLIGLHQQLIVDWVEALFKLCGPWLGGYILDTLASSI